MSESTVSVGGAYAPASDDISVSEKRRATFNYQESAVLSKEIKDVPRAERGRRQGCVVFAEAVPLSCFGSEGWRGLCGGGFPVFRIGNAAVFCVPPAGRLGPRRSPESPLALVGVVRFQQVGSRIALPSLSPLSA